MVQGRISAMEGPQRATDIDTSRPYVVASSGKKGLVCQAAVARLGADALLQVCLTSTWCILDLDCMDASKIFAATHRSEYLLQGGSRPLPQLASTVSAPPVDQQSRSESLPAS